MEEIALCAVVIISFIAYGKTSSDITTSDPIVENKAPVTQETDCGVIKHGIQAFENEEKKSARVSTRVVNGLTAELGQFPWTARLGIIFKNAPRFHCGGSLITRSFVITAAHCGDHTALIRVGQTFMATNNQTECDSSGLCAPSYQDIKVKRVILEDHCRLTQLNDLMLIEIEQPAELNDFVQPICLPPPSLKVDALIGKQVYVAGWGLQKGGDAKSTPKKLLYVPLTVHDPTNCKKQYRNLNEDMQLCLGSSAKQYVCNGDSGSGVTYFITTNGVRRAYVVGLVSYGSRTCLHNSIHTFVGYYLDSINTKIGKRQETK